jgi:hypothetical protein
MLLLWGRRLKNDHALRNLVNFSTAELARSRAWAKRGRTPSTSPSGAELDRVIGINGGGVVG